MARSDLVLPDGRILPADAFSLSFARGGGPGGQHVNTTESKVDLRLDLARVTAVLTPDEIQRIRERLANRIDAEGRLYVIAGEHKSRYQNLQAAIQRLTELLLRGMRRPKTRRATRPTRGSKERRLQGKREHAEKKRNRQKPADPR